MAEELNPIQEELLEELLAGDPWENMNTMQSLDYYHDPEDHPHPWISAHAELVAMGYLRGVSPTSAGLTYFKERERRIQAATDLRESDRRFTLFTVVFSSMLSLLIGLILGAVVSN